MIQAVLLISQWQVAEYQLPQHYIITPVWFFQVFYGPVELVQITRLNGMTCAPAFKASRKSAQLCIMRRLSSRYCALL